MKNLMRVILVVLAAGLLDACGGGGSEAPSSAAAPAPVAESHDWDSWNWDEGSFGD